MAEDNLAQFKQILAKLPEDKRKLLYKRLHDMPASEREAFIKDFVKKYNAGPKKQPAPKVTAQKKTEPVKADSKKPSPSGNPTNQKKKPDQKKPASANQPAPKKDAPVKKTQPEKSHPAKKAPEKVHVTKSEPEKKEPEIEEVPVKVEHKKEAPIKETEEKPAPKKQEKNAAQSIILGLLVAFVIVGVLYFIYVFNKAKIDSKFNQFFGMPAEETIDTTPDEGIMGPEPKHFPTETPTPIPATPTPTSVPLPSDHPDLTGLVIVIDPGHQAEADTTLEESIPGTTAEKERATTGAVGVDSGVKEYELTLQYALIMKEYFEGCGAEVILTRDTNDVNISNIERAKIATDNNADYFIRIHADSAPDADIKGVKVYVPYTGKYSSSAAADGKKLAEAVASGIGSESLGVVQSNMYTGLNHADSVRSYQIVIGYLSNSDDDALLGKEDTAYNAAVAIAGFIGG